MIIIFMLLLLLLLYYGGFIYYLQHCRHKTFFFDVFLLKCDEITIITVAYIEMGFCVSYSHIYCDNFTILIFRNLLLMLLLRLFAV